MWKRCASLHSDNNEAPTKKSKKDQRSGKATIAIFHNNQKLGCASQDDELPEQTVGPSNVRQSIPKSGKRSPRAHLSLKYTKTSAWVDRNIINPNAPTLADRDPNNTLWAEDGARKKLGNGPRRGKELAERTWRTKLHSSNQS